MNGSTIVSQVENWMTEVGEAGVRGFSFVFLPLFLPNKQSFPFCNKIKQNFSPSRNVYSLQLIIGGYTLNECLGKVYPGSKLFSKMYKER
jgi:hypothetical protein